MTTEMTRKKMQDDSPVPDSVAGESPVVTKVRTTKSAASKSAAAKSTVKVPATKAATTKAAGKSAATKTATKTAATKSAAKSAGEKPASSKAKAKSADDKPAAVKSAAKPATKTAARKTVATKSAADKAAADSSTVGSASESVTQSKVAATKSTASKSTKSKAVSGGSVEAVAAEPAVKRTRTRKAAAGAASADTVTPTVAENATSSVVAAPVVTAVRGVAAAAIERNVPVVATERAAASQPASHEGKAGSFSAGSAPSAAPSVPARPVVAETRASGQADLFESAEPVAKPVAAPFASIGSESAASAEPAVTEGRPNRRRGGNAMENQRPASESGEASPATAEFAQAAAGQTNEGDPNAARGSRGRKLRTPFRRRRGDATGVVGAPGSVDGSPDVPSGEVAGGRGAEREAEQMLSYLEHADRSEQRLGKYLNSDAAMPKLHKVLADAGIGSRREMEELITAGRVSVNGEPAHIGQRVSSTDLVRVNGKPVARTNTRKPPRVILYHKPAGEIVSHDDPGGRANVFARLPKLRTGKWLSVGRLDLNTEGLLIFTTSGDMANRIMHPRYGTEREYAVRVLGEMDDATRKSLVEGIQLEDGMAAFGSLDYLGGDGSNRWYRVTLQEGRNREVRRMFEAVGVTVSRLIRTRFGDLVLPRNLRRGRWDELDSSLVTALMVQLGLLRDDDDAEGGRHARQPRSHDSALPPGFGTLDRNGMNGARIGRRGKLQGGRPGSAGQVASSPSDPFGTGLMFTGGYANGHPLGKDGGRGGKGGKPGGKPAGMQGGHKAGGRRGGKGPSAQFGGGPGNPAGGQGGSGGYGNAGQGGNSEGGYQGGNKRGDGKFSKHGKPRRPKGPGGEMAVSAPGVPGVSGNQRKGPNRPNGKPGGGQGGPRGNQAARNGKPQGNGGGKGRPQRGPRGDDWQPKSASAHESRLGFLGGGRGRGDR